MFDEMYHMLRRVFECFIQAKFTLYFFSLSLSLSLQVKLTKLDSSY